MFDFAVRASAITQTAVCSFANVALWYVISSYRSITDMTCYHSLCLVTSPSHDHDLPNQTALNAHPEGNVAEAGLGYRARAACSAMRAARAWRA